VAPDLSLDHVQILIKPSVAQQASLDQLLRDQQNPASTSYRQWLTPEAYADRFGLTPRDHAKIVDWLRSQGVTVQESSRGRNWISFAGSAAQISKALHTSIHSYAVNGETHFANATDPSVPEVLADMVAGFAGLNSFLPKSGAHVPEAAPKYTSGSTHYLSPADYATIYDIKPLYSAGIDGTGQSIVVVGESDISLTDIRGFRTDFGLPAMDPKLVLYGTDPGFNNAQGEANLDIEWSGAIAQKATIYYVYGQNAFVAWSFAVSSNLAPVISISWGYCESDDAPAAYRTVAQQANAQGITMLASSGDSGAATCDTSFDLPLATHGRSVGFPANLPEVTAVGGQCSTKATAFTGAPIPQRLAVRFLIFRKLPGTSPRQRLGWPLRVGARAGFFRNPIGKPGLAFLPTVPATFRILR
jgi:subtilase family serine protease